jgi:hypothetical protein
MRLALFDVAVDQLSTILAGHGYDVGGSGRESAGDDDGIAGISTLWIVAVLSLTLLTAGLVVWLDPGARRKLRSVGPKALIAVIIAAPLVVWTATAGGDENIENLMVERWIAPNGAYELLVSLGEDDLNTLRTTKGKKNVRVVCVGRGGQLVLDAEQKWPFPNEAGYDYPHAHQAASREQLQRADSCRLRGTRIRLEAEVEGALPR